MKSEKSRLDLLEEFDSAPDNALFNQKVIAAWRDCSTALLERERWAGNGIPYLKIGHAVRYRKSDCLAWLNSCVVQSTTEADLSRSA
jgi:hypothetical protein